MAYYRLGADLADMSQYWKAQNNRRVRTILGVPLAVEDIELPFVFNVTFSPGIDGEPKRQPLFDFVPNTNTMHKRLVQALRAAGVDNLQTFAATVVDTSSGDVSQDFELVNVIGLVAAADLSRSSSRPLADVHVFERLAIDPASAQTHLLFRLAESQIDIVIDERVADAVREGNFTGVVLEPLE